LKIALNTGICHIISVGMYESIIDPRYIFEDDESKVKFSSVLTQEEKDYFEHKCFMEWDSEAYDGLVAGYALNIIKGYFENISDTIKITLCEKGTIDSPPYYNYRTDELDFEVDIEQEELNKILSNVMNNHQFFKWANRFKSRPGFISWMPYCEDEFIEAIKGKDIERALSMYLTFLYDKQNNFEEHEFGHTYDLYERISCNHGMTEFIKDERAIGIYSKAYDETA